MTLKLDHIFSGDCREVLTHFPGDSVDLITLIRLFLRKKSIP